MLTEASKFPENRLYNGIKSLNLCLPQPVPPADTPGHVTATRAPIGLAPTPPAGQPISDGATRAGQTCSAAFVAKSGKLSITADWRSSKNLSWSGICNREIYQEVYLIGASVYFHSYLIGLILKKNQMPSDKYIKLRTMHILFANTSI